MAKVKGPLMSLDASGTLAGEVRFRHQSGHVLVYRNGAPGSVRKARPSPSQARVRAKYADARLRWQALTPKQRRYWEDQARALDAGLSAWNCFLSCVLLGGMCLGGQYAPPPLSETITLFLRYEPPPLAKALMLAEE